MANVRLHLLITKSCSVLDLYLNSQYKTFKLILNENAKLFEHKLLKTN